MIEAEHLSIIIGYQEGIATGRHLKINTGNANGIGS